MSEEWGPWIEHDGKGCPCVGMFVHVMFGDFYEELGIAGSQGGSSWNWSFVDPIASIVRYRIRKPRGMTILEELIADLPQPATEKETA